MHVERKANGMGARMILLLLSVTALHFLDRLTHELLEQIQVDIVELVDVQTGSARPEFAQPAKEFIVVRNPGMM